MARSEATALSKENTCPQCGGKVSAKAKFCTHCGYKITSAPIAFPRITESAVERKAKDTIREQLQSFSDPTANPSIDTIENVFKQILDEHIDTTGIHAELTALLMHPYRPLREKAAALLTQDEKGIELLKKYLEAPEQWLQSTAIRALGRIKAGNTTSTLVHILETHDDLWLRRDVILAMGEIGDIQAFNPLMRALTLPEPELVTAAIHSLKALGDAAAAQYMIPLLVHRSPEVTTAASEALLHFGEGAVQSLVTVLPDHRSTNALIERVLDILVAIPDQMAAPILLNMLNMRPELTLSIIRVMSAWRFPEFLPALKSLADGPDQEQRIAAGAALRRFK